MSNPEGRSDEDQESPFVRVECYAGHRADTEPRAFHLRTRRVAVDEILDRWLDPEHRYFKLRGDDGGIYLLRHDTGDDQWELILFDSGLHDETRLSST
jgi:hypothetical protein